MSEQTKHKQSVNDLVLDACRWHVDAEAPRYKERALAHFQARYEVLLRFLADNGLLADPSSLIPVEDWLDFQLRARDLTPDGLELYRQCCGSWEPSFGQAHMQRHLVQWKRKLALMLKTHTPPN